MKRFLIIARIATQAGMAFAFYNAVEAEANGLPISLTGHSLGGGLAGLVAANDSVKTWSVAA